MKKAFVLLFAMILLNGCAESVALIGTTAGGASSGKMAQSSLHSVASYGIKKKTGKTPLQHAFAYVEKTDPKKKQEPCSSFTEKTNLEMCEIVKKKIYPFSFFSSSVILSLMNNKCQNKKSCSN